MSDRIHAFAVDYRKRDHPSTALFDRGFFVHGLPRLTPLCRLLGHKPVVDGVGDLSEPRERRGLISRWVVCDRCGIRPEPQGSLDPELYGDLGAPYDGPWRGPAVSFDALRALKDTHHEPGPWPTSPRGEIGGQLVLGEPGRRGFAVHAKVGHGGSEHTLAAHVTLWPLGGLYVHTERFGEWLVRRLNPVDLESRVIELSAHHGRLHWRLWAKRDSSSRNDPRWQTGSLRIDPRDVLLGERRYTYTDEGEAVTSLVRMPHGDDHEVVLQLQSVTFGRPKGRRHKQSWSVDWTTAGPGIPTKPGDRGRIYGSGAEVSEAAVREGSWPAEATAAIAARLTACRTHYSYRPANAAA